MNNIIRKELCEEIYSVNSDLKNAVKSYVAKLENNEQPDHSEYDNIKNLLKSYLKITSKYDPLAENVRIDTPVVGRSGFIDAATVIDEPKCLELLFWLKIKKIVSEVSVADQNEQIELLIKCGFVKRILLHLKREKYTFFVITKMGLQYEFKEHIVPELEQSIRLSKLIPDRFKYDSAIDNDQYLIRAAVLCTYFQDVNLKYLIFSFPEVQELPIGCAVSEMEKIEYTIPGVFRSLKAVQEIDFIKRLCADEKVQQINIIVISKEEQKILEQNWKLKSENSDKIHWLRMEGENE